MSAQYPSNDKGQVTAVQVPIDEWELIKMRYPDVDNLSGDLPQWQKDLIDRRLDDAINTPGRIRPIDELLHELEK